MSHRLKNDCGTLSAMFDYVQDLRPMKTTRAGDVYEPRNAQHDHRAGVQPGRFQPPVEDSGIYEGLNFCTKI